MPSSASGFRLAAATAAGSATPDATRFRTASSSAMTEPASVVVPTSVTRSPDDLDVEAADPGAAVTHPGQRDRVADEQQPIGRLETEDERPQGGMDVDAVRDQLDVGRVVQERGDGQTGRPVVDAAHRVEQVGRGAAAGRVAGPRLVDGRRRVAHRRRDPALAEPADQLEGARQLRRDRDQAQAVEERLEVAPVHVGRGPEVGRVVRAAARLGEERALRG